MRQLKIVLVLGMSAIVLSGCVLQSLALTAGVFLLPVGAPSEVGTAEIEAMTQAETEAVVIQPIAVSQFDGLAQSTTEQGFPIVGVMDAPVTVELYTSFTCSHCADFNRDVLPVIVDYVIAGDVQLVYIPAEFPNPDLARKVSETAFCLSEQGVFWQFQDVLYRNARDLGAVEAYTDARIDDYVAQVGADADLLADCRASGRAVGVIEAAATQAQVDGLTGVPSVSVNDGALTNANATRLQQMIDEALNGA
jgi:protein-disulfide isomerase